jgi:hypothetical protein
VARVNRISVTGELCPCNKIEFARNELWTKLLGFIPASAESNGVEVRVEPESEYILQRLIEFYPSILPWDEFHDSADEQHTGVCVVSEEVSSAATDILLVERTNTGNGRFVIVETKLVKNPEIYREVLGQVLEYAGKLASGETPTSLERKAAAYWKKRPGKFGGEFTEEMKRIFSEQWRELIWDTAFKNLRKGDIRLLIVSDQIPEDLRIAIAFLPSSVLLSGVEVQPHGALAGDTGIVASGVRSTSTAGVEPALSGAHKYFGTIRLSLANVQWTESGYIVSQALDRGKLPPTVPGRPYEDHFKKLGGIEAAPGKMLDTLREKTLATDGRVDEGRDQLTFRLWNLAGLNAKERNKELSIEFWPHAAVGVELSKEASKLFESRFTKEELALHQPKKGFSFRPVTSNSSPEYVEKLAQKIEAFYEDIHRLKLEK